MSVPDVKHRASSSKAGEPAPENSLDTHPIVPQAEKAGRLNQVGQMELRRRLWHMLPGLLPFLLWPIPHADPISPTLRAIMILVIGSIAGWIYFQYRHIARNEDRQAFGAVAGYAGSVIGMLLLFPWHAELGLTVLAVLAFGDGSATLGGLLLRGPTLPWNRDKTWAGSFCFVLVGAPLAAIIYWGESHNLEAVTNPDVSYTTALLCGSAATFAAAVSESIATRINDNIRVGLTAAVTLIVAHGWLVGWS